MRVAEWKISQNSCATEQTDDNVPRLDKNEIPNDITVRIHGQSGEEVGQGRAVNPRDKIGGRHFFFSSTGRRSIPSNLFRSHQKATICFFSFRSHLPYEEDDPFCAAITIFSRLSFSFSLFLSLSRLFFAPREESSIIEYGLVGRGVESTEITVCVTKMYRGNNKYRGVVGMEWYCWRRENWRLGNIEEGRLEGWDAIEKRKLGNIERLRYFRELGSVERDDSIFGNINKDLIFLFWIRLSRD